MTQTHGPTDQSHFSDLDGVRGLLAIVVMLFHYGLNTILGRVVGIATAEWGVCVDFFFVLSGFVICKSVTDRPVGVVHFANKRVWRLFPLNIVILIMFFPVLSDKLSGPGDILLSATAIAPLVLQPIANFPAWSMGFEFYLPILFVAFFSGRSIGRATLLALTAAFAVLAALAAYQLLSGQTRYFGAFLDYIRAVGGLGLGFCAWRLYRIRTQRTASRWAGFVFVGIIAGFFGLVLASTAVPGLGLALPPLILAAILTGAQSRTVFSTTPFQWAGRLSFGIYMVHIPVLLAFGAIYGQTALDGNIALKGLMIVVSVTLALMLHLIVERPGMHIVRGQSLRA